MRHTDHMGVSSDSVKFGLGLGAGSQMVTPRGTYIIHLEDSRTGEVLDHRELSNVVTLDGGVLQAILIAAGPNPSPAQSGLTMLAVGTGATGSILNPDAPDERQRVLNAEVGRKSFLSTQFRTAIGAVSSVPTRVIDFTTSFGEGEAVGPLNEMGLMRTISQNPAVRNPITPTPVFPAYDPTVNLTLFDILANYTTFSVVSKPTNSILTLIWRLTY